MKKFTSIMLMLLFAVTTWGQRLVTDAATISSEKVYTLTPSNVESAGVICVSGPDATKLYLSTHADATQEIDPTNINQRFAFITIGSTRYLYSLAAQKFVYDNGDGTGLTETPTEKYSITFKSSTGGAKADYPLVVEVEGWQICAATQWWFASVGNVVTNWNDTGDAGCMMAINEYEPTIAELELINSLTSAKEDVAIIDAELATAKANAESVKAAKEGVVAEAKITAINEAISAAEDARAALNVTDGQITRDDAEAIRTLIAAITTAAEKATYVQAIDELSNGVAYAIKNPRGSWVVNNGEAITGTTKAGITVDTSDEAQQFAILKSSKGNYYLYSISEGKFVKKDGSHTRLTESPVQAVELLECSGENKWVIALVDGENKYHMGISNGYDPALITHYNDLNDEGNQSLIEPVRTINLSDVIAKLNECTITYNLIYNGEVKATQTSSAVIGSEYPAITVALPYGITAAAPQGNVNGDETVDIALTVEKPLPFETATTVEGITKWYYAQMHVYAESYMKFIQDNNDGSVEWADLTFDASEIDSHLWGFVGDAFGVKVINKGTGNAITSTSGDAATGDAANATAFLVSGSDNTNNAAYFCLKYPGNNYYLNAQGSKVASWDDNDNGSSLFVTEYEEFTASISDVKCATLFLDFAAYIPAGVKAYAVTSIESNYAAMEEFAGAIPANQGAILQGEAGEYTFKRAPKATAIENNLLLGTATGEYITAEENTEYYVLGLKDEKAVLGKALITDGAFVNNANKAYLPVTTTSAEPAAFYSLGFDWGGTTGIENIEGATEENNAVKGIYDLTGRKVETITAPGIYIINGKKMLVK